MKKLLFIFGLVLVFVFVSIAWADSTVKTLTFEWTQEDTTNLKEWKLFWSDTSGGEYTEAATIIYDPEIPGPVYTSPEILTVSGEQGTHVLKYFVLRACGDVPTESGGTEYKCSGDSNEVSHKFWIPAGMFSVPINFSIKVE